MKTHTSEELKETVRLHGLWLSGDVGGIRANISGSSLSSVIGFVYIGQRSDGYRFHAVYANKHWRIKAGCHNKTIDEYRAHVESYYCETKRQETLDLLDFAEKRIKLLGRIE